MNKPQPPCEICHSNESKYTCPACSMHTCSLDCFKKHKTEKSCSGLSDASSGTRDKYINKTELAGEDVQRDYNFLLKMNRSLELSKRKKTESKIMAPKKVAGNRKNQPQQQRTWVSLRGVKVKKLPFGMERGKINKSGGKANNWSWTVEWLLIDAQFNVSQKYTRYRSSETSVLEDLVPEGWVNNMQDGSKESYMILLKNLDKRDTYTALSPESKLSEALLEKTVIEFPTFYVVKEDISANTSITIEREDDSDSDDSSSDSSDSDSDSSSDSDSDSSESDSDSGSDSNSDGAPEESSSKIPVDE